MEHFYRQIVDDSVFTVGSDVVFLDWEGEYCEVTSAMRGWCDAFERLANDTGKALKLLAIRKMAAWLSVGTPIPENLIKSFREELDACSALYAASPAYQITRSMRVEMIQIELEAKGIIG